MSVADSPEAFRLAVVIYLSTKTAYGKQLALELLAEVFEDFDANAFIPTARELNTDMQTKVWVSKLEEIAQDICG